MKFSNFLQTTASRKPFKLINHVLCRTDIGLHWIEDAEGKLIRGVSDFEVSKILSENEFLPLEDTTINIYPAYLLNETDLDLSNRQNRHTFLTEEPSGEKIKRMNLSIKIYSDPNVSQNEGVRFFSQDCLRQARLVFLINGNLYLTNRYYSTIEPTASSTKENYLLVGSHRGVVSTDSIKNTSRLFDVQDGVIIIKEEELKKEIENKLNLNHSTPPTENMVDDWFNFFGIGNLVGEHPFTSDIMSKFFGGK